MASYNFYQPTASDNWIIPHNLNSTFLAIDVLQLAGNNNYQKIQAAEVLILDNNTVSVRLTSPTVGRARLVSATNR